jgi:hypothetical protein
LTYHICPATARVVLLHLFPLMYPKISPLCSNIQVLHAEYMDALTKVQSAVRAIEAAYDQLSAIESGHSWFIDQI